MALKTACFWMSLREGTLFFLFTFLIEGVMKMVDFGHFFANLQGNTDEYSKSSVHIHEDQVLVLYANAFIALMSVIFIAAIIYVLYNKPAITLLSAVIAVLLLELIFRIYADFNLTFGDGSTPRWNMYAIKWKCISMMFRILFTLYGVMVIHGYTIELKNNTVLPVNFINPQYPTQTPQCKIQPSKY